MNERSSHVTEQDIEGIGEPEALEPEQEAESFERPPTPIEPAPPAPQLPEEVIQAQEARREQKEKEKKLKSLDEAIRRTAKLAEQNKLKSENKYRKKSSADILWETAKRASTKIVIGAGVGAVFGAGVGAIAGVGGAIGSELGLGLAKLIKAGARAIERKRSDDHTTKEDEIRGELEEIIDARNDRLAALALAAQNAISLPTEAQNQRVEFEGQQYTADELRLMFLEYVTKLSDPESEENKLIAKKDVELGATNVGWKILEGVASLAGGIIGGHVAADAMRNVLSHSIQQSGVQMHGKGIGELTKYGSDNLRHMQDLGHNVHLYNNQLVYDYNPNELAEVAKALNNAPDWLQNSITLIDGKMHLAQNIPFADFSQAVQQAVGAEVVKLSAVAGLTALASDIIDSYLRSPVDDKNKARFKKVLKEKDKIKEALPAQQAQSAQPVQAPSGGGEGGEAEPETTELTVGKVYEDTKSFILPIDDEEEFKVIEGDQVRIKKIDEARSEVEVEFLGDQPEILKIKKEIFCDKFELLPEEEEEEEEQAPGVEETTETEGRAEAGEKVNKLNEKYSNKSHKFNITDPGREKVALTDDELGDIELAIDKTESNVFQGEHNYTIKSFEEDESGQIKVKLIPERLSEDQYEFKGSFYQGPDKEENLTRFTDEAEKLLAGGEKVIVRLSTAEIYVLEKIDRSEGKNIKYIFSVKEGNQAKRKTLQQKQMLNNAVDWYVQKTAEDNEGDPSQELEQLPEDKYEHKGSFGKDQEREKELDRFTTEAENLRLAGKRVVVRFDDESIWYYEEPENKGESNILYKFSQKKENGSEGKGVGTTYMLGKAVDWYVEKSGENGGEDDTAKIEQKMPETLEELRKELEKPAPKVQVIGDIHGDLTKLNEVIDESSDKIIFLGDFIDRGADSIGVFEKVKELVDAGKAEFLLGNHEAMFIAAMEGDDFMFANWINNGGDQVLEAAGATQADYRENPLLIKWKDWLRNNGKLSIVQDSNLYVHAGLPLDDTGKLAETYEGRRGLQALRQMEEDLKSGKLKLGDWAFGEISPLYAGDPTDREWEWYDRMQDPKKVMDELNETSDSYIERVIFGHSPDQEGGIKNFGDGRILGIDAGMTDRYGGHGGSLFIDSEGIRFVSRDKKGDPSKNPIISSEKRTVANTDRGKAIRDRIAELESATGRKEGEDNPNNDEKIVNEELATLGEVQSRFENNQFYFDDEASKKIKNIEQRTGKIIRISAFPPIPNGSAANGRLQMMRYQSSNDTLTLFFDVTAFPYHERMVGSYEQFLNDYSGRNKIKEALSSADRPEVVARANDNSLYRIESYYEEGISRTGKGKLLDNETLQPIGDALDINCNAVSDWYIKPKNAGENINPGGEGKDYSAEVKTILDAKSPEELEEFIDKYQKQEFIERWWVSNLKEGIKLLKAIKANDFEKLQPIRVLNLICRDIFDINNYSGSDPDRAMKVRQAIKDRFEQLADEARKELEKRAGFKFYNSESELGKEFDPSKHTVGEIARRPWREGDPPLTHGDQTILEVPAMGFSINGKLDTPAQVILAEKPSNDETEQASSLEVEFGDGKKLEIKPGSKFVLDGHSIEVTDLQSKENDTFVLIHKVDGSVGTTEKTATKQEWQTLFEGAYRERRLEI